MQSYDVEFYHEANGTCPVQEFLNALDWKMRAKILKNMELLEQYGNQLREPFSKPLEDGIFELRSQQGSDITRIFYFFCIGHKIIVTNGFVKKTNKTPREEIALAKKYRQAYLSRKENYDE